MSSDTGFDPTGEKKARKQATFGGAIVCAFFNAALGVLLAFCVLALTAPPEYKAAPDAKTGKPPPLPPASFIGPASPAGIFSRRRRNTSPPSPAPSLLPTAN